MSTDPLLLALIAVIAALYSSVGHGGATGYLAIMSVYGMPSQLMASAALFLNVLTAGISCFVYGRSGFLSFKLALPFILISIPCSFAGAVLPLSDAQYSILLGAVLLLAASRLFFQSSAGDRNNGTFEKRPAWPVASAVGGVLGFLAGAIGIGGGVFLSPLIILLRWADAKTTSGCAALFIVANSITGLVARHFSGRLETDGLLPFLAVALVGSLAGSIYGARVSSPHGLMKLLAVVLLVAVIKMSLS